MGNPPYPPFTKGGKCFPLFQRGTEGDFTIGSFETANGMIGNLVDLKAVESISSIRRAFEKNCVDFTILGDVEDVEIELGLRKRRSTPATYPTLRDQLFPSSRRVTIPQATGKKQKVGRNEPCPCGSGKKYKKCCLNNPKEEVNVLSTSAQQIELSPSARQEILKLVTQGTRIEAVRRVMQLTGAGLKVSKDYVDDLQPNQPR